MLLAHMPVWKVLAACHQPGQVLPPAMAKIYRIELDELDLGQLLDGLEARADAWEKTQDGGFATRFHD